MRVYLCRVGVIYNLIKIMVSQSGIKVLYAKVQIKRHEHDLWPCHRAVIHTNALSVRCFPMSCSCYTGFSFHGLKREVN